jgi:hypothetical protein
MNLSVLNKISAGGDDDATITNTGNKTTFLIND